MSKHNNFIWTYLYDFYRNKCIKSKDFCLYKASTVSRAFSNVNGLKLVDK